MNIKLGVVKPKLFEEYLEKCIEKYNIELDTIEHLIYGFEDI